MFSVFLSHFRVLNVTSRDIIFMMAMSFFFRNKKIANFYIVLTVFSKKVIVDYSEYPYVSVLII